jgi:hypothetical protein
LRLIRECVVHVTEASALLPQVELEATAKSSKARWTESEERALLHGAAAVVVTAGPRLENRLVPWSVLRGVHHSHSAAVRRITFYRTVKAKVPYRDVIRLAGQVHEGRVARARERLQAAAVTGMQANEGAGQETLPHPSTFFIPSSLCDMLAPETVEKALDIEDLSAAPEGRLFVARSEEEEELHGRIVSGLELLYAALPITHRSHGKGNVGRDTELELVCRPAGKRRGAAAHVLSAELAAVRSSGLPAASLREAGGGLRWQEVACAVHLVGLALAGRAVEGEPLRLLRAFSEAHISAAMLALRRAHVLQTDAAAPLRMTMTRQCFASVEAAVAGGVPRGEVGAAAEWLRGRLRDEGEAGAEVGPQERVPAALVAIAAAGLSGGHLEVRVRSTSPTPQLADSQRAALDQFGEGSGGLLAVRLVPSSTAAAGPGSMHAHLLMPPKPLSLSPSSSDILQLEAGRADTATALQLPLPDGDAPFSLCWRAAVRAVPAAVQEEGIHIFTRALSSARHSAAAMLGVAPLPADLLPAARACMHASKAIMAAVDAAGATGVAPDALITRLMQLERGEGGQHCAGEQLEKGSGLLHGPRAPENVLQSSAAASAMSLAREAGVRAAVPAGVGCRTHEELENLKESLGEVGRTACVVSRAGGLDGGALLVDSWVVEGGSGFAEASASAGLQVCIGFCAAGLARCSKQCSIELDDPGIEIA